MGGLVVGVDVRVSSVVTDSRLARPGALFVALKGSRSDGHAHLADAYGRGAVAAIVRAGISPPGPSVAVADPGRALLALGASGRAQLRATVVAITGSSGKTTTKDLTARVLSTRYRVHASPGSFNNEIGVPLTILGAPPKSDMVVCEIGAGCVGEIAALTRVARPHIGIVTTVGLAHVETFGSPDNIRRAKAELVEELPPEGLAILNEDDPVTRGYAGRTEAAVVRFGSGPRADVRATNVCVALDARPRFMLSGGGRIAPVALRIPGRHMVWNALAAAACGLALGVSIEACADALGRAEASPGRMEVRATAGGVRVIHDAYNANPASMEAAIRALRAIAARRRIAVLGPMAELGPMSEEEHDRIGRLVSGVGIDYLATVGRTATRIGRGATRGGMATSRVHSFEGKEDAARALQGLLEPGDVVLVKASRAAGLEAIVAALNDLI